MQTIITLLVVAGLPITLLYFLPKKVDFFKLPSVKGFGLGVYAALIFVLIKESLEITDAVLTFGGLFIGFIVSILISYYFKEFHHHHDEESNGHFHSKVSAIKILVSDFMHNIIDGIAIVSGFIISPIAGITSAVGVLGHQFIQQSGQQILLAGNGVPPKKALFVSFLVSLSVFVALVLRESEILESLLMTVSAGIITLKVLIDIKENKWNSKSFLGFIVGFVLLLGSLLVIPHSH
jgi:zinc transporter ZupT